MIDRQSKCSRDSHSYRVAQQHAAAVDLAALQQFEFHPRPRVDEGRRAGAEEQGVDVQAHFVDDAGGQQ